jgi:hypothetical protein
VVATKALRLGDEAEQPLHIATCECRHGTQKIRRTPYSHNRRRPACSGHHDRYSIHTLWAMTERATGWRKDKGVT